MERAFVFPGQGSQHLSRLMFDGPESDLTLTENAQPALLAASLAAELGTETPAARGTPRDRQGDR